MISNILKEHIRQLSIKNYSKTRKIKKIASKKTHRTQLIHSNEI